MRTLYFDCANGIAGDMTLGALVDLGVAPSPIIHAVASIDVEGELRFEAADGGTRALVLTEESHAHRRLRDILPLIEASEMPPGARDLAARIFGILAEAEADAHGTTPEEVTFHEVGAVDSIIDVCGIAFAIDQLAIDRFACGRVNLGSGEVVTTHGKLGVPAPAVERLLDPVAFALDHEDTGLEMTTPTGAAVLRALVPPDAFDVPEPAWRGHAQRGLGVGTHPWTRPRPLRIVLGNAQG